MLSLVVLVVLVAFIIPSTRASENTAVAVQSPSSVMRPSVNIDVKVLQSSGNKTIYKMKVVPNDNWKGDPWILEIDQVGCGTTGSSLKINLTIPEKKYPTFCNEHQWIIRKNIPGFGEYVYYRVSTSWIDARCICTHRGMHLVILNSEDEAKAVAALINEVPPLDLAYTEHVVHIGFHDMLRNGEHVTLDGNTLKSAGYDKWVTGKAINSKNTDCGGMDRQGLLHSTGCLDTLGFICEK